MRHYTPASYDTAGLREHRARTRREALAKPGNRRKEPTLNLHVKALDRYVLCTAYDERNDMLKYNHTKDTV